MNNKQIEFVKKVYPAAERLAKAGGVSPLFVTAQAALETGWEIRGIGNNIFGITKVQRLSIKSKSKYNN